VLRLDGHGYSPMVLKTITEAAARLHSHQDAAYALGLTGLQISARHVCRIATEVGSELAAARDQKVALRQQRRLPRRVGTPPQVVAIGIDGGRMGTRAPGCGPGVHQGQPKEDKIACLTTLKSSTFAEDPQPEPPPSLLEARRVQRLVRQIHGSPGDMLPEEQEPAESQPPVRPELSVRTSPVKQVRTCVASLRDSHAFGPMVAAEAQERGFYEASRKAFVCDGQGYNWWIHKAYFKDFVTIADLLHVACYLYVAAWAAGGTAQEQWSRYEGWLRSSWQGRVPEVIEELQGWQERLVFAAQVGGAHDDAALGERQGWQEQLGEPPKKAELAANNPCRLVAEALSYLRNNQGRMDYPRYRKAGLPVTSSLVESLVGEFNARVKGKDKYWDRLEGQGGEAMLQLRAAVLSEDERLARHFAQRPGNPYRRGKTSKKVANVS
jgi:hypothetical protein